LCFADNLLIFSAANMNSLKAIQGVLLEFEEISGLRANPAKSSLFCAGISDGDKIELLDILQVKEYVLPVR
jgi:hypothetical protein